MRSEARGAFPPREREVTTKWGPAFPIRSNIADPLGIRTTQDRVRMGVTE